MTGARMVLLIGFVMFVGGLLWMTHRESVMDQIEATFFSFVVFFGGLIACAGVFQIVWEALS